MNKLDSLFQFHQQALSLHSERQKLIASNIANADTPGFKARDIDFVSALKNAQASQSKLQAPGMKPLGDKGPLTRTVTVT